MEDGGIYLSSVCRGVRNLYERQLKVEKEIIGSLAPWIVRVVAGARWVPQRVKALALRVLGVRIEERVHCPGYGGCKVTTKTVWALGRKRGSFQVSHYEGWDRNRIGIKTQVVEKWP